MRKLHVGKPVVRSWISDHCTFKEQAIMLSALRGCDGIPKEDISKKFTRKLRSVLLYPATIRIMSDEVSKYMKTVIDPSDITHLVTHLDHYPMHWVMHFAHACQIVGACHPSPEIGEFWKDLYTRMTLEGLHLNIETESQREGRLADEEFWCPLREDLITCDFKEEIPCPECESMNTLSMIQEETIPVGTDLERIVEFFATHVEPSMSAAKFASTSLKVEVCTHKCKNCGFIWTDHEAEDIRDKAVKDYLESLKKDAEDSK